MRSLRIRRSQSSRCPSVSLAVSLNAAPGRNCRDSIAYRKRDYNLIFNNTTNSRLAFCSDLAFIAVEQPGDIGAVHDPEKDCQ